MIRFRRVSCLLGLVLVPGVLSCASSPRLGTTRTPSHRADELRHVVPRVWQSWPAYRADVLAAAAPAWTRNGAPGGLTLQTPVGYHRFNAAAREFAYEWLGRVLDAVEPGTHQVLACPWARSADSG